MADGELNVDSLITRLLEEDQHTFFEFLTGLILVLYPWVSLLVFEIRNTEDLTEEWLREKLGFFH